VTMSGDKGEETSTQQAGEGKIDGATEIEKKLDELGLKEEAKEGEERRGRGTFDPLEKLNENQMAALEEMRSKAKEHTVDEKEMKWCNDMCLLRYLRARDYNVTKSEKMLKATLEWKRELHPDEIKIEDVEPIARTGCVYANGFDLKERPLVMMRPSMEGQASIPSDIKFKHLLYWLEKGFRIMDESKGVETFCLLVDYKNYSSRHMDMKTNLHVLHYMLNHLPERLGVCLFLDPPLLFWVGWKVMSPFLNEVTLSKVKFVYSKTAKDGKRHCPELFEFISQDVLEAEYGGRSTKVYNYDAYVNNNYEL